MSRPRVPLSSLVGPFDTRIPTENRTGERLSGASPSCPGRADVRSQAPSPQPQPEPVDARRGRLVDPQAGVYLGRLSEAELPQGLDLLRASPRKPSALNDTTMTLRLGQKTTCLTSAAMANYGCGATLSPSPRPRSTQRPARPRPARTIAPARANPAAATGDSTPSQAPTLSRSRTPRSAR